MSGTLVIALTSLTYSWPLRLDALYLSGMTPDPILPTIVTFLQFTSGNGS